MTKEEFEMAIQDAGINELHPTFVEGWQRMCLGALAVLVTAKRGKKSDDPALSETVEEHLGHATEHTDSAYLASEGDSQNDAGIDAGLGESAHIDDDGLPHMDHATARIALAHARLERVRREAEGTKP